MAKERAVARVNNRRTRAGAAALAAALLAAVMAAIPSGAGATPPPVPASMVKKEMTKPTTVKVEIRPNLPKLNLETGQWYSIQNVDVHYKTEWKGITHVTTYYLEYIWARNWTLGRINKQMEIYLGVDPPTDEDIKKALAASSEADLFDTILGKQVSKVYSVRLAKEPKFSFRSPNEVTFQVEGEFELIGFEELKRVRQTGTVGLKRKGLKDSWSLACAPDSPCLSGGFGAAGQRFDVSSRKLSREALSKIDSVWKIGLEKWVGPKYDALGAPAKFKDLVEFTQFAYKALYTGDLKTWDAFMVRNHGDRAPEAFNKGRDWFINNATEFRRQYCPNLVLAERPGERATTIRFFDRGKVNKGFIKADWRADGFWVTDLAVDVADGTKADEIAAIADVNGCVDNLPAVVNLNPEGFKAGDRVRGKRKGWSKEYSGVIQSVNKGNAMVRFNNGSYEDMRLTDLKRE